MKGAKRSLKDVVGLEHRLAFTSLPETFGGFPRSTGEVTVKPPSGWGARTRGTL